MKIYLDTGNLDEIKEGASMGVIDGVTTNPSLIAKEGGDFKTVIHEITKLLGSVEDFTVSAEVTSNTAEEMIKEGEEYAAIDKHVIVKVPLNEEGLKATKKLSERGIRCNVTLCFSANQALLAAKAGAFVVSPFIGRLDDIAQSGMELVKDIKTIYDNYMFKTKILVASIRHPIHVLESAKVGADIVTVPFKVFKQMYKHPLTDKGLQKFLSDWEDYMKKQK